MASLKQYSVDNPSHYDSDVVISRLKVVDEVGEPAPGPDPNPDPDPGPVPSPGPFPRPREIKLVSAPVLSARFSGKRAVSKGAAYTFRVTYRADAGNRVDVASLGNGDAVVSGPGGFAGWPQVVKVRANKTGTIVRATYRVSAPGGAFDAADNGTYTVSLPQGAVASARSPGGRAADTRPVGAALSPFAGGDDLAGGQTLGGFIVRAKSRPAPAAVTPAVAVAAAPRRHGVKRVAESVFS
jgi:hypothetical protein